MAEIYKYGVIYGNPSKIMVGQKTRLTDYFLRYRKFKNVVGVVMFRFSKKEFNPLSLLDE